MAQRICVVGAGSWGTTVAALTSHNVDTTLWTRRAELADEINSQHTNSAYLGDSLLPESLRANCDIEQAVSGADVIAMAVPSQGFHSVMNELSKFVRSGVPILSLSKGLEQSTFKRMSEVITEVMPHNPVAVLSGPNLAKEILAGQPAASVIACSNESIARELISVCSRPTFRLYTNPDVIGCEIGGVVKNVVAIASGISQGFGFGENSKATLVTRGLAEMSRLGVALGAQAATFSGLAGMGDVMATCASMQSRNTQVGVRLGKGENIDANVASMNMVAEGVKSSASVVELAHRHSVEMPIAEQVAAVCAGRISAADALRALMSRQSKSEFD
jgi:glycerol-3-phosphate dehydrogenase (NAD(P)+)